MDTPLISNLNILENIALIDEALYRVSTQKAQKRAYELLNRLNLSNIANKRPAFCEAKEIFLAQILRAYMLKDSKIVIITPSKFLVESDILELISSAQRALGLKRDIIVIDLITNRFKYENRGFLCHIRE